MATDCRAGDIILVDGRGFFSDLILYVTSRFAEWRGKRVPYTHAALVVNGGFCVEALDEVEITPVAKRLSKKESKRYIVLRPKFLNAAERKVVARRGLMQVGRPYSWWRLLLCWIDGAVDTRLAADADTNPHRLVCSTLVAYCFRDWQTRIPTGRKFNGVDWMATTPEDIWLDYQNHPKDYEVVAER